MTLPIIDTPTFNLTIPGTKEEIKFRPFLVKEDKILTLASTSDELEDMVDACIQVVTNCSSGKLDAAKLAMYQLQWVFLELRKKICWIYTIICFDMWRMQHKNKL